MFWMMSHVLRVDIRVMRVRTQGSTKNFMSEMNQQVSMKAASFELKTPKGTREYGPKEMAIRQQMFDRIVQVFKRYGAITIDTPAFELFDVLTGKYGEDSKLIYELQDQGGEKCALRYDQTVPFARYLAMNGIKNMKRYQIAKVFRRDQPCFTRGRYREFYQCDFDIAGGNFEPMLPDAEVMKVIQEVLSGLLGSGSFVIRFNSRKILDGVFRMAGIPEENLRPVSSAVDKLDKMSWNDVRAEMVNEKGVKPESADIIGKWVVLKGDKGLIDSLLISELAEKEPMAKEGLNEMKMLYEFLDLMGVSKDVLFDMSLARGLDYYTGVIFEAVLTKGDVGSVAGGGRYDNLVGMFNKSGEKIPCVGVGIGVERIFTILEASSPAVKQSPADVMVVAAGSDMLEDRIKIVELLRSNGINADYIGKRKAKLLDQFSYAEKNLIPFAVVLGDEELKSGNVKIRDMATRQEQLVDIEELIDSVKCKLALPSISDLSI